MIKKGDTLIEVTLAIGIFSMVAVSVVAVMGNGTAGAETALETTLTREEIDAQADALRFIHSSFISDENHEDDRYAKLWDAITKNAIELTDSNKDIVDYPPTTCDALYSKGENNSNPPLYNQGAFVVNTDYLGAYSTMVPSSLNEDVVKNTIISYKEEGAGIPNDKFTAAKTYPHLIYQEGKKLEDESTLTANYNDFARAEGIYVIAVKDPGTEVAGVDAFNKMSAFYDFYIRTCWYGVGDDFPSTISTVIRLYNPDAIIARKIEQKSEYMQDISNEDLDKKMPNNGDTTTIKDSRDGKEYGVAKINNQYWMTTNLAIGCKGNEIKSIKLNSDNTSISKPIRESWDTPTESLKSGDSFDDPRIECDAAYGGYYNYAAATAGTLTGPNNLVRAIMNICPKGWRLPSESEAFAFVKSDYSSVFSPIRGGYYSNGTRENTGSIGLWWTLDPVRQIPLQALVSRAAIVSNDSGLDIEPWLNRQMGASIRCVKGASQPQSEPSMQEADSDYLASKMPNDGDTTTLKDSRDDNSYKITRINNRYWMTQNLRFTGTTLDPSSSNVGAATTISYDDLTSGNSVDQAKISIGKDNKGDPTVWYNYAAASAMTVTGSSNTSNATYDICPAGWRLPTDSEFGSIASNPNNFNLVAGGWYMNAKPVYPGYAMWWSASASDNEYANNRDYLFWNGTNGPGVVGNAPRDMGAYIRCIRKE